MPAQKTAMPITIPFSHFERFDWFMLKTPFYGGMGRDFGMFFPGGGSATKVFRSGIASANKKRSGTKDFSACKALEKSKCRRFLGLSQKILCGRTTAREEHSKIAEYTL